MREMLYAAREPQRGGKPRQRSSQIRIDGVYSRFRLSQKIYCTKYFYQSAPAGFSPILEWIWFVLLFPFVRTCRQSRPDLRMRKFREESLAGKKCQSGALPRKAIFEVGGSGFSLLLVTSLEATSLSGLNPETLMEIIREEYALPTSSEPDCTCFPGHIPIP